MGNHLFWRSIRTFIHKTVWKIHAIIIYVYLFFNKLSRSKKQYLWPKINILKRILWIQWETVCQNWTRYFIKLVFFWRRPLNLTKSPFYFWLINSFFCVSRPILNFQWVMSGSQSWNFIHWDQPNPSKVYLFLDTDKFILSFFLIFNKSKLCRI